MEKKKKKPNSKVTYHMISLIHHSVDNKSIKMENSGRQGLEKWREGVLERSDIRDFLCEDRTDLYLS